MDVTVHADADQFAASDAGPLNGPEDLEREPPAAYAERGLVWPPRMAPESLVSYGMFGDQPDAHARLHGVVTQAATRRTALTGQAFHVARVRTVPGEVDVCVAADDHAQAPRPGNVVGGTVFMVASVGVVAPAGRGRRGLRLPWRGT